MFLLNLLLALAWLALTAQFTPVNFAFGFVLSYGLLWLFAHGTAHAKYFRKAKQAVSFTFFFIKELVKSNLRVAYDVVTPTHYMRPGVIAIPLEAKTDLEITLLCNLITLTPGTFSLDVSADRRVLYVHEMYVDDPEKYRREIKEGLERRLLEVLR